MKQKTIAYVVCVGFACFFLVGCGTVPKGFLKPSPQCMQNRQLQMRQYDTKDEQKILASVAGVLQDLGFILDNSETQVGFVAASKKADAISGQQIAGAVVLDIAAALLGVSSSSSVSECDRSQLVKASVITKPSLDGSKIIVRVTFQRMVWNMNNHISKIETIIEEKIYLKFYDALSKAIFLEAEKI